MPRTFLLLVVAGLTAALFPVPTAPTGAEQAAGPHAVPLVAADDLHVHAFLPLALRGRLPGPGPTAESTPSPTADATVSPTAEPTTEPTEDPTAAPTAEPTMEPTVEPTADPGAATFALEIIPNAITNSVPGQRCVFLVAVRHVGPAMPDPAPIALDALAPGAEVVVEPAEVLPGVVAEIKVIPGADQQEQTVPVTVRAVRGGEVREAAASLDVLTDMPGVDEHLGAHAAMVRDAFMPWLQTQHPELGISAETDWEGTVVTPQWLVVMHYLYFSAEWEMHVSWHVTIAPHDWARVDLRRRFTETRPSHAFEISSWSEGTEPVVGEVPEAIWR
jgi:hypothetical protein